MPVPRPGALVVKKGSKMCGRTWAGIPLPVSVTRISTCEVPSSEVFGETAHGALSGNANDAVAETVGSYCSMQCTCAGRLQLCGPKFHQRLPGNT